MNGKYKIIDGTAFNKDTNEQVCRILADVLHTRERIQIYYGDTKTGRDWHEEMDVTGYVGRSTGTYKIPLMIHNSRCYGGPSILDHCIVKIVSLPSKRVLYQHKKYKKPVIGIVPGDLPDYPFNTIVDGELHGRHKTLRSAQILKNKLQ